MKKLFLILALLGLVAGGFAWLAVTEIPVEQTQVRKTIDNTRFF